MKSFSTISSIVAWSRIVRIGMIALDAYWVGIPWSRSSRRPAGRRDWVLMGLDISDSVFFTLDLGIPSTEGNI